MFTFAVDPAGVEAAEWWWHGTYPDGAVFEMRGTTILGVSRDHIAWARLYMEPVQRDGVDIETTVQETYRPPSGQ